MQAKERHGESYGNQIAQPIGKQVRLPQKTAREPVGAEFVIGINPNVKLAAVLNEAVQAFHALKCVWL
jgi:hypothetical protein